MRNVDELKNLKENLAMMPIIEFLGDTISEYVSSRQAAVDALKLKGKTEEEINAMMQKMEEDILKHFNSFYEREKDSEEYKKQVKTLADMSINIQILTL